MAYYAVRTRTSSMMAAEPGTWCRPEGRLSMSWAWPEDSRRARLCSSAFTQHVVQESGLCCEIWGSCM